VSPCSGWIACSMSTHSSRLQHGSVVSRRAGAAGRCVGCRHRRGARRGARRRAVHERAAQGAAACAQTRSRRRAFVRRASRCRMRVGRAGCCRASADVPPSASTVRSSSRRRRCHSQYAHARLFSRAAAHTSRAAAIQSGSVNRYRTPWRGVRGLGASPVNAGLPDAAVADAKRRIRACAAELCCNRSAHSGAFRPNSEAKRGALAAQ
jgi:hypothetical protein